MSFISLFAQSTQTERDLIRFEYRNFENTYGSLDTSTIKAHYDTSGNFVISSKIIRSLKSFIVKGKQTDNLYSVGSTNSKYLVDTNIPANAYQIDSTTTTGFVKIQTLDNVTNDNTVEITNGIRTDVVGNLAGRSSPMGNCITNHLHAYNWIQWIEYAVGMPESTAFLILECVWETR